jgi:predicted transcriptional regulator
MIDEKDPALPAQTNPVLEVLKLERITPDDITHLTKSEKKRLLTEVYFQIGRFTDDERDEYLEKVRPILDLPLKNRLWQNNHTAITRAISDFKKLYNRSPDKSDIAEMTGLSHTTVYKHFKEYRKNNLQAQLEQFEYMAPQVLDALLNKSLEGNVNAARLFLKVMNNPQANGFGGSRVKIDEDIEI